jgi:hypothetical protein
MPAFEERIEEFRCTISHNGRRVVVTLPVKERYTVEEVLREAQIELRGYEVRRANITLTVTDTILHGHHIEVVEVRQQTGGAEEIKIDIVAFGQRHSVRLPRRDGSYTVEEVMQRTTIPNWNRCQFRRGDGYTVETTTVVENGHVIYVLTKIKGN